MKNLYIIGAGGFSSEVLFVINRIQCFQKIWNNVYLVDPKKSINNHQIYNLINDDEALINLTEEADVVITVNDINKRAEIFNKLSANLFLNFPNIIDVSSIVNWEKLTIGIGNIIMHNVILSSNLTIGNFNIFNSYTGIGHDTCIGNFNTFNPRVSISGNVFIGNQNTFGLNSSVLQNVKIGSRNNIWFSTTITKNIKYDTTYFGIPPKKIDF
jgi:sugar O-acyltransferase (sialic acid O-acetyltransferase NeuD family)